MLERSVIVKVFEGLHARPAARLAKLAKTFACEVELWRGEKKASAKSSVKLMLLAIKENEQLILRAEGGDAEAALQALTEFLMTREAGLEAGDKPELQPQAHKVVAAQTGAASNQLQGLAVSDGLALGAPYSYFPETLVIEIDPIKPEKVAAEITRFKSALAAVQARMNLSLTDSKISASDRNIISALAELIADPDTQADVEKEIHTGKNAVSSVDTVSRQNAAALAQVDDAYLRARGDDIMAIGRQLCLELQGKRDKDLQDIPLGAIVVAEDIGAFDLAKAPLKNIAGLICAVGGTTSHIAIIARSHSIPAVFGLGQAAKAAAEAKSLALDGSFGTLILDPTFQQTASFNERLAKFHVDREKLQQFKSVIPKRSDGHVIEVAANIGSLDEIDAAKAVGAMGVGLFRTELLFMQHRTLPSEQAQFETYAACLKSFAPYPVIIRTLDVGGDKPLPGVDFPKEENPFLGWRGIRMCLDRLDLFKPQLRALLRASISGKLKVMLPMVSDLSEITRTKELLKQCQAELHTEGIIFGTFELGIMVETPAAVFQAAEFAKHVAFFSIGTNDLTQYVMAADRMNTSVAKLNDVANPAVMAAIAAVAAAGTKAGIMVGMCGEAAGREDLVPQFIKMGISELSMSPSRILPIKKLLAGQA